MYQLRSYLRIQTAREITAHGFAGTEMFVALLVVCAVTAAGFAVLSRNEALGGELILKPADQSEPTIRASRTSDPKFTVKPPVLKNLLGIKFGPYSRGSQVSGDFIFSKAAAAQAMPGTSLIYVPFGQKLCPVKTECKPHDAITMNGLKLGTDIIAVADGQITGLTKTGLQSSFSTASNTYFGHLITYNYIYETTVKEGQFIKAGQFIGKVAPYSDGIFGRAELSITRKPSAEIPVAARLCPFDLLDPVVKPPIVSAMYQFVSDWNAFVGTDVYRTADMATPGCHIKQVNL